MATFTLTPATNDAFTGSAGQDNFYLFTPTTLQGTDTVTGRDDVGFSDILAMTAAGTVTAGQWAGVTKMEQLRLSTGTNNVTLTNGLVAGSLPGYFIIADGGGDDTVDGSGITNGIGLQFFASTGNETFRGGNGSNQYGFAANELTAGDTVAGGSAFDNVWFSTAGAVAANAFSGATNIESITLNAGGNSIALSGAISGSTLGFLQVVGGAGDDTVNLSGVTSGTVVIYGAGGTDTFTGGAGSAYYLFDVVQLSGGVTVTGGAGFDVVQIQDSGNTAADAFDDISNLEAVFMNAGGNDITLTDATVANSMLGHFVVVDGAGNDTVNASGVTSETLQFWATTGNEDYKGGGGTDVMLISAADLDSADSFEGNGGIDYLQITSNGAVTAGDLGQVTEIEFVGLGAGGSVQLVNNLTAGTTLFVTGTAAADTFDGSLVTTYGMQFHGFGGADVMTGGSQSDSFYIQDSAFASIDGNGGIDYLVATQTNQVINVSGIAANVSNIEAIWLDQATGVDVTLAAADIGTITPGNVLYVVGDSDDTLDAGTGWVLMNTNVVNNAVAPGYEFNEFFHTVTGATLFVEEDIVATIGADAGNAPLVFLDGDPAQPGGLPDGNDHSASYTTGEAAGVKIADVDATVDDPDTVGAIANIAQLVAALTNPLSNDGGVTREYVQLSAAGQTIATNNGLTVNGSGTTSLTISGAAADTVYQDLLREIVYVNLDEREASDYATARTITVDVQDQSGLTALQRTSTITLTNGNQDPVAADDNLSTGEDTPLVFAASDLTGNDNDGDGNALTVTAVGNAVNGTVNLVAGTITFTPASNFHGSATFEYTVQDSNGATDIGLVTVTVTPVNDSPTGGVTITGIQQEDQVLTADTSTLADADGLGVLHYQWQRDDGLGGGFVDVGLDQNTYTLGDADVDATIRVVVSYTDNDLTPESVTSAPTGAIANVNDPPIGGVTVTGIQQEDQVLTADTTTLQDPDGLGTLHYQWQRDDGLGGGFVDVGLDQNTYTLGDADVGASIRVIVDYVDQHGMPEEVTSAGTGPIANVNDPPTGGVTITGTATEDQVLTADTSTLADLDGLGTLHYEWQRDTGGGFVVIGAADQNTYTLGDADVDATIRVVVNYTDQHGSPEQVISAGTGPVANVNDLPTGGVTISGTAAEDATLTANTGALVDNDGLGPFHYQWQRDTGGGFVNVGADQNTYLLGDADVGATIQVIVSYLDGHGTPESVTSSVAGPVAASDDPPVNSVPGTQTIAEDAILTFSTGNGNAISISDPDAGGNVVEVAVVASSGLLTLNGTTGLTFSLGDGTADASLKFQGTIADINAALDGLQYSAGPNANGSATVTIITDDLGNTGAGGPLSDNDSVTVNITAVNDTPVNNVPGTQTFNEDTNRTFNAANGNLISITDVDSGAGSMTVSLSVLHGTLSLSGTAGLSFAGGVGDGTDDALMTFSGTLTSINAALNGLVYKPTLNYNSTQGVETLTITTNDNGNTGTDPGLTGTATNEQDSDQISLSVTPVNDAPTAANFTFNGANSAIGNTSLVVNDPTDGAPDPTGPQKTVSGDLLAGGSDVDTPSSSWTITAVGGGATATVANVGSITFQTDGDFTYFPFPGFVGDAVFQYQLNDNDPLGNQSAVGQITIHVENMVWYVDNTNTGGGGGDGTSDNPFSTLAAAQTASAVNDTIFVDAGDGTTTGQNSGITLKAGQHLIGEGVGLDIAGTHLVDAGTQARIGNSGGDAVSVSGGVLPAEIRGFGISASGDAIEIATSNVTGTLEIANNTFVNAGAQGINFDKTGTGTVTLNIHDNTWTVANTHTGNAVDVKVTNGTTNLNFSNNLNITSSGANGVVLDADAPGALNITGFANNTVHGNTSGNGIVISDARFDADLASSGYQTVNAGATLVGTPGSPANPVGGAGVVLSNVSGDLSFSDLKIFAGAGAGLQVAGTNAAGAGVNISAGTGFRLSAALDTSTIEATGGAAVDVSNTTADLRLLSVKSTNSTGAGVSLNNVRDGSGTDALFRTGSGAITDATGTDFVVNSSSADVTYSGTITDDVGQLVALTNNVGGTIKFTGAITDGDDGDGSGISITGNANTTIEFSGGLTLSTGGNAAFTATGNNSNTTLTVLDPGTPTDANFNKITTTTATALNIRDTDIGAANLTFRSISSTGSGSSPGIVLINTDTAGGLKVTGFDGGDADAFADAGSGGTIANKTGSETWSLSAGVATLNGTVQGVGIYMDRTSNASFSGMQLNDFTNAAIMGFASSNLTLNDNVVSGASGSTGAAGTAADESALFFYNVTGTNAINRGTYSGGLEDNLHILNNNTAGTFTVTGTTFGFNSTADGNNNISVEALGASANVTFSMFGSLIKGSRADFLNAQPSSGGTLNLTIGGLGAGQGNTFDNTGANAHPGAVANGNRILLQSNGTGNVDILGNVIKGSLGYAIAANSQSGIQNIEITGNDIGVIGVANSGSTGAGGILVQSSGGGDVTSRIHDNDVVQYNNHGIQVLVGDQMGQVANVNVTVSNNRVSTPGTLLDNFNGFHLNAGQVATDNLTITLDIHDNDFRGSGKGAVDPNNDDLRLRQRQATTVVLPGYVGPAKDAGDLNVEQVITYLLGRGNQFDAGPDASANNVSTGGGYVNGPAPPLPLLAAGDDSGNAGDAPALTQAQLDDVAAAARAYWAATGLSAAAITALEQATVTVADLDGQQLGLGQSGHIVIDVDAAGHGWFVDVTPGDSAEFGADGRALSSADGAAGHYDLLTAVLHEMGHALGLGHDDAGSANSLMNGSLEAGERRLPTANDAAQADMQGTYLGNDHFAFGANALAQATAAAPAVQHVTGYSAAQGDVLDFSALTAAAAGEPVDSVVRAVSDTRGFTTVEIDTDGAANGHNWVAIAQLDGVAGGDAINVDLGAGHAVQIHASWLV